MTRFAGSSGIPTPTGAPAVFSRGFDPAAPGRGGRVEVVGGAATGLRGVGPALTVGNSDAVVGLPDTAKMACEKSAKPADLLLPPATGPIKLLDIRRPCSNLAFFFFSFPGMTHPSSRAPFRKIGLTLTPLR